MEDKKPKSCVNCRFKKLVPDKSSWLSNGKKMVCAIIEDYEEVTLTHICNDYQPQEKQKVPSWMFKRRAASNEP